MKTLYLTNSYSNICIDPETNTAEVLDYVPTYDINRIYYIDEPMHIVYSCGETKAEKDVKKGDIVITFDRNNNTKETPFAVIKSKEWNKVIKNRREAEQKAKEEWAKKNAGNEMPCCDCCCGCDAISSEPVKMEQTAATKVKKMLKKSKK